MPPLPGPLRQFRKSGKLAEADDRLRERQASRLRRVIVAEMQSVFGFSEDAAPDGAGNLFGGGGLQRWRTYGAGVGEQMRGFRIVRNDTYPMRGSRRCSWL